MCRVLSGFVEVCIVNGIFLLGFVKIMIENNIFM